MKQMLHMRDFLTFQVQEADPTKKYLHEAKDSASETGYSLLVHLDATHSGIVNGNARFYRPDLMANSVHTWGSNKKVNKPVLVHHNEESDALGRVKTWKYVDLRHEYGGTKFAKVGNLLFYDAVSAQKMDLFKSVDWVYDNLQRKQRDYAGLGKIQLGLNVTNPDAIGKIQREEYSTVSVGFKTDAALCSICHQDWASDGKCEHRLGQVYDGKRAFVISGNFDYDELSFVNFPADKNALVLNHELVSRAKDNLGLRVFFLGKSFEETGALLKQTDQKADTAVSDLFESDIAVANEEDEMDLDALRAEIYSDSLTRDRALAIKTELKGNAAAKSLLVALNNKIRKQKWEQDSVATKEEVEAKIASLADTLKTLSPDARKAYLDRIETEAASYGLTVPAIDLEESDEPLKLEDFPEADRAFFSKTEDEHYELLAAELEDSKDAKLSSEKRSKLKGSTFCGPGRSFPVPDCAHVTAARRLVGRASVSEDTKKKILACVSRKASSLGCGGKDAEAVSMEAVVGKLGNEVKAFSDGEMGKAFVTKVESLHSHFKKMTPQERRYGLSILYNSCNQLEAGERAEALKTAIAGDENASDALISKVELAELNDAVEHLETERTTLSDSLQAARDTNKSLVGQLKHSLAVTIVSFSVLAKEPGFTNLTKDQIEAKINERAQRQLVSLQDALRDLEEKLALPASQKTGQTSQSSAQAGTEGAAARDVKDNAKVGDNEHPTGEVDPTKPNADSASKSAKPNVRPIVSQAELRDMRQRSAATTYKALKQKAEQGQQAAQ